MAKDITPGELIDLARIFEDVKDCCLHETQWDPKDVEQIIVWEGDRTTGCESSSTVIVRLPGPAKYRSAYGLFQQSEDYTGHGCQCFSMTLRSDSLGELLTHLDDSELLGLLSR